MNWTVEELMGAEHRTKQPSRVCLLSARNVRDRVSDAIVYEVEDLIREFDRVDMFTYDRTPDRSRRVYSIAHKLTRSRRLSQWLTPAFNNVQVLEQDYDLFFVVARNIFELQALKSLKNWRNKCNRAVCYLAESWNTDEWLRNRRFLLEPLKQFDAIFVGSSNSVEEIAAYTGVPCFYMPIGVDTLRFCPFPNSPERAIDLACLGRRSPITHEVLLSLSQTQQFFYLYDTAAHLRTNAPQEHRIMYANLLKRSRYFITNYARADEPDIAEAEKEIGYRFFEGAAAGTVMIGCPPKADLMQQYFNWEDAVIPMPFDAPNIAQIIAELDAQPERLEQIRINGVVQSLQQHDWVYRWKKILATVGLRPTRRMQRREAQLYQLSQRIASQATSSLNSAEYVR